MVWQLDPSRIPIPEAILGQVTADRSPALQICSNTAGIPVVHNATAARFAPSGMVTAWTDLLQPSDCERWSLMIRESCSELTPVDGLFGLKRFDNSIRTFVLRAEPQFNSDGIFVCHLVSGLDVTEVSNLFAPEEEDNDVPKLRNIAEEWREQLISAATIIRAASDIVQDLSAPDEDPLLRGAVEKLAGASAQLTERVQALSLFTRSGKNAAINTDRWQHRRQHLT